ncbi:DnaJ domain-containing protein [Podospora fimiseda]|uniref:DnaJ domain-containing protein n=1 Tax=Podospora fimiseda TaxID=252190 RepID=A0AAN7GYI5_9PEZI|nr:DnaJ domain-containing protein [Podospora fimiseda]
MPLRYNSVGGATALHQLFKLPNSNPIIARQHQHPHIRFFTTSPRLLSDDASSTDQDHYETLEVRPTATPAEIKKSYFRLSKLHHPDTSSSKSSREKFHLISESYAVLSNPSRRSAYDRSRPRHYHHSHSSVNPAGGRPPSGLSRRRSPFQGPPPSFYRSGGYGSHASKRRHAHESSTAQEGSPDGTFTGSQHTFYSREKPGMGFGEGFQETFRARGMPHFDSVAHERTHRNHEQRRAQRQQERMGLNPDMLVNNSTGWITSFIVVSGCLLAAIAGGVLLGGIGGGGKNERERRAQGGGDRR